MKLFSKSELNLLWPFYLEGFLGTLLFIMIPFQVLYFNSIGLSFLQIGILLAIWSLSSFIFEIPTGAIADLYGRKFSVILSGICLTIIFALIFFTTNYYFLISLFLAGGASLTLSSGSYDAWIVDLLKTKKNKKIIHDYFIKRQSFYNLGFVFSGLLGALVVAKLDIGMIWIFSSLAFLVEAIVLLFAEENYKNKIHRTSIKKSYLQIWTQTKKSIRYGYNHYVLFFLLLIGFILAFMMSFQGFISWTSLLKNFNFPDLGFGYLWAFSAVLGVFAPFLSKRFVKRRKERKLFIFNSILILLIGFAVLISYKLSLLIFLFLLGSFISDFERPVMLSYFHKFIPSKMRATIGSVEGMLLSLGRIISLPLAGFLVDKIGGRYTIFASSLLMIPVIVLYLMIKEKRG